LTPDNKARIKLKDIFSHPWVVEQEKEAKEAKLKNLNDDSDINYKLMAGIFGDDIEQVKNNKIISKEEKFMNDLKPKKKEEVDEQNNVDAFDIDFKVKNNKKKIKNNEKEELVLPKTGGGDYFDSVLGKVKEKNKGIII
jgi:hypothetical protein